MMKQRNIFLIMAEDICPNFGCYGDVNAKTPNLDAFALENIRFEYCSSAAPVCSAARSSLNLGMYASTVGAGQHRSMNALPPTIKNFGQHMQNLGYYTAISKTDLNFPLENGYDHVMPYWFDDSENFAKDAFTAFDQNTTGKPFFIIHTNAVSHQSQYGYTNDTATHRSSMKRLQENEYQIRDEVVVPKYHFDTPQSREIWGQYHEKLTSFDRVFGDFIDELKRRELYEDAIIFVVGDNGHGIPSGKCHLWNEGVQVPFLLRVPKELEEDLVLEKDDCGKYSKRLTSFVDFLPSVLSIAGQTDLPHNLQGKSLFGKHKVPSPTGVYSFGERVDEVFENSRSLRESKMLYICDFGLSPFLRLNTYQTTQAPYFVSSMITEGEQEQIDPLDRRGLFRQIPRELEHLFDMEHDQNQFVNLATQKACQSKLEEMRAVTLQHILEMRDDVFMPEAMAKELIQSTGLTVYELLQDESHYPLKRLVSLYETGLKGEPLDLSVTHPCEKLQVIRLLFMRNTLNDVSVFMNDTNEMVRAYASFVIKDIKRLQEICCETKNFYLLLHIADWIATWRDDNGVAIYETLYTRYVTNHEFAKEIDDRYHAAMSEGLNMLALRFDIQTENRLTWDTEKKDKTMLVMRALGELNQK